MTSLLSRATRRSRFLFEFDAARALAAPEQALDATTGQAATFARTSVKYALDVSGRYRAVAHSLPAYEWMTDPVSGLKVPVVLLEDARTNLVIQSDVTTAANGWTLTGAITAASSLTYAGRPFTLVASASSGGTIYRTLTFTGNGTKAFSFLIRADGSVTGTAKLVLYDVSASATRATITATIAIGGAITFAGTNGAAIVRTETLADGVYRVHATGSGVVAANTNRVYVADGGGSAASYLVSGVQVEDATFPSSLTPTTSATVTRAADALSFTFLAPPSALTVYARFVDLGSSLSGGGVVDIGGNGSPPRFIVYGSGGAWTANHSGSSTATTAAGTLGVVELRGVLNANGSTVIGQSLNGATEVTGADATALTLESAWNTTTLYLNRYNSSSIGFAAFQSVRIALGAQTLAYMRAG